MNPEVMEVAREAGVAWVEITVVPSINLVGLRTKDHIMILNRIIQTTEASLCKTWARLQIRKWDSHD